MMRNIRFTVTEEVFDALQAEAAAKDTRLATLMRDLVTARHNRRTTKGASPSTSTEE